jgi:hypothetical protein
MFGGVLMLTLATRGIDSQESPSPFFFELGMLRLILCAIWALVHLALNVSNAHVFFINRGGNELLAANCILGAARCVILVAQAHWHRLWCVGDGWKLLQSSAAPAALWHYYMAAFIVSTIGTAGNQAFTWHTAGPSDPSWTLNFAYDTCTHLLLGVLLQCCIRPIFIRGGIMTTIFCCCAVNMFANIVALLVHYYVLGVTSAVSGFDNEYGFASLSAAWGFMTFVALYYMVTWEQVSDAVVENSCDPPTMSNVQLSPSSAIPSSAGDQEDSIAPEPQAPSDLLPIAVSTTPIGSSVLWAERSDGFSHSELVTAHSFVRAGHSVKLASIFPHAEPFTRKHESSLSPQSSPSSIRVSSSQIQLHRLAIGAIEMLSYSGFIFTFEWIVALSFPSLRSCGQATASWSEFLLSVFDLFSS